MSPLVSGQRQNADPKHLLAWIDRIAARRKAMGASSTTR